MNDGSVAPEPLRRGDLIVDFNRRLVTYAGKKLETSATEFDLLAYLARAAPHTVPAEELASQAQGYRVESFQQANATLRYHFYRLRRKIKQTTGRDDLIKTVHGVGYTLYQRQEPHIPSGAVTFLFTDIQDSTTLWEQFPYEMKSSLARHDAIVRQGIEAYGGYIFKTAGDMFCAAFSSAADALSAGLSAQRTLSTEHWTTPMPLRVRMAIHTGPAEMREGDYFGATLNHLGRMMEIGHGGQILVSEASQQQLAQRLLPGIELRDLGVRRIKGMRELMQVFQLVAPDIPVQFGPLKTLDPSPTNLPAPLSSFIGREWELRQVTALLRRPDVRLLTLTGVGGAGKTRLSVHAAAHFLDEFQDGVFFVPLATVTRPELVAPAIARVVGVQDDTDTPVFEQLTNHLRARHMLLLIDNFEQVLDAATALTDLLQAAPHVKFLVTSRQALDVYGEHAYPLAALTTPDPRERFTLAQLERYEAAKLFIERAHARMPHLTLTEPDAPLVVEICACLDGLPLAIELAAAQTREFSLAELATQLQSRLGVLAGGPRDAPARHRTLRGLLDWSYHLLTLDEQALFARLAVFVGGWTGEAAQAVGTWQGDEHPFQVQTLEALLAKHLIQPMEGAPDHPRLTMLQTVREYALERLAVSGDMEAVRRRHAHHYLSILERAEPDLIGGQRQKNALWMCEVEQDNFRAALQWALENDIGPGLGMVKTLWRFWGISSQLNEGRRWMVGVLAAAETASPAQRAPVMYGLGKLSMFQGDYPAARRASQAALELYQQVGDDDGVAWCMNALGEIAFNLKEYERAREYLESSLGLYARINNKLGTAKALDDLGRLAMTAGDYVSAAKLLEESLQMRRARSSPEGIAVGLLALGEVLRLQGNYEKAETYTRESLARYRQLNHTSGILTSLNNLASIRFAQQDTRQAIALYLEELGLLRDLEQEERELVLECLAGLAQALYLSGEPFQAAQIVGAYEHINTDSAFPQITDQNSIRAVLGQAEWARATAQGRVMSVEDLLHALARRSPSSN